MRSPAGTVFSIPACQPFLEHFADALNTSDLIVPGLNRSSMRDAVVILPNDRCRSAFFRVLHDRNPDLFGAGPVVLSLGSLNLQDVLSLPFYDIGSLETERLRYQTALFDDRRILSDPERRILLFHLVSRWRQTDENLLGISVGDVLTLANDLAQLLDDFGAANRPVELIDRLDPGDISGHWESAREFLQLISRAWPKLIQELDREIFSEVRYARMRELARLVADRGVGYPVILAGSTGREAPVRDLMKSVLSTGEGAVVLAGLDTSMPDGTWKSLTRDDRSRMATHPQFALASVLNDLEVEPKQVREVPGSPGAEHWRRARETWLHLAMLPAAATDTWAKAAHASTSNAWKSALDSVSLIEASDIGDEARCCVLQMRSWLEDTGESVLIVTPDVALARRIVAEGSRFDLRIDDQVGEKYSPNPLLGPLEAISKLVCEGLSPQLIAAFIASLPGEHPHSGGSEEGDDLRARAILLGYVLRGPVPPWNSLGIMIAWMRGKLDQAGSDRNCPRSLSSDVYRIAGHSSLAALSGMLAPVLDELQNAGPSTPRHPLATWCERLNTCWERIILWPGSSAQTQPDQGLAADAVTRHLHAFAHGPGGQLPMGVREAVSLIIADLKSHPVTVRRDRGAHATILSAFDARFVSVNRVILAGLVEDVWPPRVDEGPWLTRPMREKIGLDPPEWQVGLSAQDFVQMFRSRQVVLTLRSHHDGSAVLPSRWIQRLQAISGPAEWEVLCRQRNHISRWADALDRVENVTPLRAPTPCPPLAMRPRSISITGVRTWLENPYEIFATRVLKLSPWEPIGDPTGPREWGNVVHESMERFLEEFPSHIALPADAKDKFVSVWTEVFRCSKADEEWLARWSSRMERVGRWIIGWEKRHRRQSNPRRSWTEVSGSLSWSVNKDVTFRLTGRADRIDRLTDGTFVVIDYKTGQAPSPSQVRNLLEPQLLLAAAIAFAGGFNDAKELRGKPASAMKYIRLSGTGAGGEDIDVTPVLPMEVAEKMLKLFQERTVQNFDPNAVFSVPLEMTAFERTTHLSRRDEWSLGDLRESTRGD